MDTPTPESDQVKPEVTLETKEVHQGELAREINGETIYFNNGLAGSLNALNDIHLGESLAFIARAEGNLEVENSGAAALIAGGDLTLTNGGGQVFVVGGSAQVSNGGAQVMVVGGEMNAHQTFVGIAVTNQLNLSEDSKVLLDKPQALLFGAAFGAVFALVSWLLKRRR